jgi:hypothetical protein
MLDDSEEKRRELLDAYRCRICGANLTYNQPVASSCPAECPLRDLTTIPGDR